MIPIFILRAFKSKPSAVSTVRRGKVNIVSTQKLKELKYTNIFMSH